MSRALAPVLATLLALAACKNGDVKAPTAAPANGSGTAPAGAPAVVLHPPGGEVVIRVEVARTSAERSRGLMFRKHLDPEAGMIFLFDRPEVQKFWMINTLIPLDMIFIDGDRRIVGIVENAEPKTEQSRFVARESQFVLELNGGSAARLGLQPGQPVEFRNFSP